MHPRCYPSREVGFSVELDALKEVQKHFACLFHSTEYVGAENGTIHTSATYCQCMRPEIQCNMKLHPQSPPFTIPIPYLQAVLPVQLASLAGTSTDGLLTAVSK